LIHTLHTLLLVAVNRFDGDGHAIGVAENARRAAEADAEAQMAEIARFTELVRLGVLWRCGPWREPRR